MTANSKRYKQLKAEISALQLLADNQKHLHVSSKQLLYEGLSRVYMWWVEANKENGLLEQLYAEYNLQFKKQTKQQIQFSPLLRYLWNMDGSLKAATIDQYNKALNNMHLEVQLKKQYFKTNTLNKLITLISSKGGIITLAGYSTSAPLSDETKTKAVKMKTLSKEASHNLKNAHLDNGTNYFAASSPIANIKISKALTRIDSGLTIALLRNDKNGYEVLAAIDDKELVEQAIVAAYKRSSIQMPHTARLITEIIRSQTLPTSIANLSATLADTCNYKIGNKTEKRKQLKRLMYVAADGYFILSANRSSCSVITIAKPIKSIFTKKEKEDLALAVNDRTYIENELIHTDNFNFYTTDTKRYVAKTTNEVASHKMKLENAITKDYRFIRFYPLSAYKSDLSKIQAIIKPNNTYKPIYKATLTAEWINNMNNLFLARWIDGFGKKIKRPPNQLIKLTFNKSAITFHFNKAKNGFIENEIISFDKNSTSKTSFSAYALSKDIVPILNALTTMEINRNVKLTTDKLMMQLQFDTDCAEYSIYVPLCNKKGQRFDDYMEAYGVV